jgi:carboxypeptidase T
MYSQQDTLQRVHLHIDSERFQALLQSGIQPVHGQFKKNSGFIGEFEMSDIRKIQQMGLNVEVLIPDITADFIQRNSTSVKNNHVTNHNCAPHFFDHGTPSHFRHGSMGGYFNLQEVMNEIDTMLHHYPTLVYRNLLGQSVENRPVHSIRFFVGDTTQVKPQVLFTSLHHSQEPGSVHSLLFFMHSLLEKYGQDSEITYLLDHLDIYFVPYINPDGYEYNFTNNPNGGGTWRKNRKNNGLLSTGVDLNRNYGYEWGFDNIGSQPIGSSPWYRGENAFSEPESQLMRTFINSKSIKLAINWHSYGNLLIYPWNYKNIQTADSAVYVRFSEIMTSENDYRYGTVAETYGYQSNGDADDWAYGEIFEKNKIISFTAEIGPMSEGFWPQSSRIEQLCKEAYSLNLNTLRLMMPYAQVEDLGSRFINPSNPKIQYRIQCLGLDTPSTFNATIASLDGLSVIGNSTHSYQNMQILDFADSAFVFQTASFPNSTEFKFVISIDNGQYVYKDTITKIWGDTVVVFYDNCTALTNWNADSWYVNQQSSAVGGLCFTESPNSNYSILNTSTLTLLQPISLTQYSHYSLNFRAKWDIEKGHDYLQLFYSIDNGTNWLPLCGNYTNIGTDDQHEGFPVYDGTKNEWIFEDINLDFLSGHNILLRYRFKSDQSNNYDGFYLDDIKVVAMKNNNVGIEESKDQYIRISPNPASEFFIIDNGNVPVSKLTIIDNLGRIVKKQELNPYTPIQKVNISELSKGIYSLIIDSEGVKEVKKLIINE